MKKRKIVLKFSSILVLTAAFNFFPVFDAKTSSAETMPRVYLQPDYSLFMDKDFLYVDLAVDSGGTEINALQTSLEFDTSKLILEQASYENSFCELLAYEKIDNQNGNFHVACGSPTGGTEASTIVRLKFSKIGEGWTKMNLGESTVLANDGLGTPLASDNEIHRIYIIK